MMIILFTQIKILLDDTLYLCQPITFLDKVKGRYESFPQSLDEGFRKLWNSEQFSGSNLGDNNNNKGRVG